MSLGVLGWRRNALYCLYILNLLKIQIVQTGFPIRLSKRHHASTVGLAIYLDLHYNVTVL